MKNVFMTGGAGFLGRAVMRRAFQEDADIRFTVYSRDEGKHGHARVEFPQHRYVLGDIRDTDRLELAMTGHDTVIHAAAMKYVPQGETNAAEAIDVNVTGSRNVAMAAVRNGVERVVGISTDKACRPINVYGVTKFLMERVFQEADGWADTRFNVARYGNVISSTGSVIPLFRRQAREGRVTLTNPEMTRFWLPVEEAVDLIYIALAEPGATILIPRLPSATMKVVTQAAAALELGERAASVAYEHIGHRFGEKVHEELLSPEESVYCEWPQGSIMRLHPVVEGPRDAQRDVGPMVYSSDKPDRSLGVEEFSKLIQDSPI